MRSKRFSEEQIIGVLKEAESGVPPKEICRQHGISEQTFYRWRRKYGGLDVSEARRLKALEQENKKLKQLLADQILDNQTLKEMLKASKNL
jgi:putative transposase